MKHLLLIAVILMGALSTGAQEQIIDKAEFNKVLGQSLRVLRDQPHRTVEEYETQGIGRGFKGKITMERMGASSYFVVESESASSITKTERILINGKKFIRKLNAAWEEDTQVVNSQAPAAYDTLTDEITYKSLGEQNFENKKVKVYQTISHRVTVQKENGFQSDSKDVTTYYFDETGLMFRSESNLESVNKAKDVEGSGQVSKPQTTTTRRVKKVEIDPSIKIEAPKIG